MGDILSQSEIDEILRQMTEGGADSDTAETEATDRKVKVFDFERPSKFAKDQLKTINIIHYNFARLATNMLTAHLRTLAQVDVIAVDALTYGDFSNALPNPDVMAIVDFSPLEGSIVLELAPSIAFSFIDRILGGRGALTQDVREFTEIETALIERTISQLLFVYRSSWDNVVGVNPRLDKIETNPQFAQIISPSEMIALVTFNVKVAEAAGIMNICIPYMVVEPILSKLTTKFWYSINEKAPIANAKEFIELKLRNTLIPVRGVLGTASVTVAELLGLAAGDVLPLARGVGDEVDVYVGELLKFKARPGVMHKRSALKITQVFRKDDD